MRIQINYDLLTKIEESKKGFSLNRCVKKTLGLSAVSIPITMGINIMSNSSPDEILTGIITCLGVHSTFTATQALTFKKLTKILAQEKISDLVKKLNNTCVKTDRDSILDSYKYKTEYKVKTSASQIPLIEQKKYIKVPVRDDYWGNREMPIVQEHIIGSNEYYISVGMPEQKVYKLGYKAMFQKR